MHKQGTRYLPVLLLALLMGCGGGPEKVPLTEARATPWGSLRGNPGAGRTLAVNYCSGCHLVDGSGHALMEAPAFAETANRQEVDAAYLRQWLANPNSMKTGTRMPNLGLDETQIEHLIAYIFTYRKENL